MKALAGLVAAICLLAPAADGTADANKKDQEKLQGTWKMESMRRNGEDAPAEFLADKLLTFDDDRVLINDKQGTFQLDAAKKPPAIDFHSINKKDPDVQGIYKLDGDALTIAFARPGKDRPAEFKSEAGSDVALIVYQREKKTEKDR